MIDIQQNWIIHLRPLWGYISRNSIAWIQLHAFIELHSIARSSIAFHAKSALQRFYFPLILSSYSFYLTCRLKFVFHLLEDECSKSCSISGWNVAKVVQYPDDRYLAKLNHKFKVIVIVHYFESWTRFIIYNLRCSNHSRK